MNRTVRNGLAVAGMAGGIFFLGQAVASADTEATQTITPTTSSSVAGPGGGDATADTFTGATNIAAQADVNVVSNDVNTGNAVEVDNSRGETTIDSSVSLGSEIAVDQSNNTTVEADSGNVSGSGNPVVGSTGKGAGGGDSVTATQTITPTTTATVTTPASPVPAPPAPGGTAAALTETEANNAALQLDLNLVDNSVNTGNTVVVDNTRGDTTINCGPLAVLCEITVDQSNNTYITVTSGDVTNSGNPSVGNSGLPGTHHGTHHGKPAHHDHEEADCPDHKAAPVAHKPAPKHDMAPAKAAPAKAAWNSTSASHKSMSGAQPSSLAYTGTDVSVPLAVGLLTLTAGMGLAFATRRRSEAAAA